MTVTMIRLTDVLGEDADYVDDDSGAAIEGLPSEFWPALVAGCRALTGGEMPGIDCEVARTRDTLADFDDGWRQVWSDRGPRTELSCAGYRAVLYERCQMHKGEPRRSQVIIDFGDVRAALLS